MATPEWLENLSAYINCRTEAGKCEERCDGSCLDADNFFICEVCKDRRNWEYRCEALMRVWGDTWATQLGQRVQQEVSA